MMSAVFCGYGCTFALTDSSVDPVCSISLSAAVGRFLIQANVLNVTSSSSPHFMINGEVDGLRDLVHRSSTCPLLSLYFFDEIGFRLTWVYFDCVSSKFLPLLESCIAMMTFVCLHFSNDLHPGRWPAENLVPSLEKFIH